jgi:hypothetical protein
MTVPIFLIILAFVGGCLLWIATLDLPEDEEGADHDND